MGGVSDTVVVITIRSLTQERKVSEESGGDTHFMGTGGASGININCEIVMVLSRIWNIWCGRTFSGHFSQEHFAAGFSMEICFRYAAGSHSSHEHIESLSHWSAASWDGLAHQFVHHAPIFSSTKKSETMRTSKSSRILL